MNKKKKIFIIIAILLIIIIGGYIFWHTVPDEAGISLEEYQKIKIGDSEFTVNDIITEEDDLRSEKISNSEKNHIYEYKIKYWGETGGHAIITYTADYSKGALFVTPVVTQKENFNLK